VKAELLTALRFPDFSLPAYNDSFGGNAIDCSGLILKKLMLELLQVELFQKSLTYKA
jgi:hypothetical protein